MVLSYHYHLSGGESDMNKTDLINAVAEQADLTKNKLVQL